ncbi:MAG TPA: Uma2 family endonuclease [Steroidobacteraceae bacterium]
MNRRDEVTRLIRALHEPEKRELLAWLTESLDDSWRVAATAARYGATDETQEAFTVEEYLALEDGSSERHEYVAGQIYAMAEPLPPHKLIAGNVFAALHGHLRGTPCRAYIDSTRVHIRARDDDYLYSRSGDWEPVLASAEQALELKSIGLALPLRQIYEGLP